MSPKDSAAANVRRRSSRASAVAAAEQKSSYFEDDVDDSSSASPPAPPAPRRAAAPTNKKRARGGGEEEEDAEDAAPAKRGRGRPPKSSADATTTPAKKKTPAGSSESGGKKRGRPLGSTNKDKKSSLEVKGAGAGGAKVQADGGAKVQQKPKQKQKPKPRRVGGGDESMDEEEHDDAGGDEEEEQVTVIPDPELRPLGGVKYEDTRVHKNTLLFLGDLKENNERAWLKSHDPEFRRALKDWESFVETLTAKIIEVDETVPELPLKDVVFRIYRDVRFSREKTPYKPNFSAAWSRTGRKGDYACYYVHVEPGECFVGGGLWHPDAAALGRLRAHIDAHPERLRAVLMAPDFRRTFLPETAGKANSSEADVVKAFAKRNREGALKTKPKNYAADHRDVALLKLRNFTIGQKIKDGDLQRKDAQEYIMELIRPMVEFVSFLNSVVKPDPGEGSEDELAESEEDPEQDLDDEQDDAEA